MINLDINVLIKVPAEFACIGSEKYILKSSLVNISGVDFKNSDYWRTFEKGNEIVVFSFCFNDFTFDIEHLKQLEQLEYEFLKFQGLDCEFLLDSEIHNLQSENEQLKNQIQQLNNKISFMSFSRKYGPKLKYKNSPVGRKNKLSDEDVNKILNSNLPYRALASEFSCSIGLISKIKNSVHK